MSTGDASTTTFTGGAAHGALVSGKIMLSAIIVLFVVVLVMVFLHLYARWYLLRSRRRHHHRRARLVFYVNSGVPGANKGLDSALLKSIPTFTYSVASKEGDCDGEVMECAVCLSEFEVGEVGRVLPGCKHGFHVDCIDMWFHSHSTCPLCRAPVEASVPIAKEPNFTSVDPAVAEDAVVIEIDDTATMVGLSQSDRSDSKATNESVVGPACSIWARRKTEELESVSIIEVPSSRSEGVGNSSDLGTSQGLMSPILSLKRMLSRKRETADVAGDLTAAEFDVEQNRVVTRAC